MWQATKSKFTQSYACLYFVDYLFQQQKQAQAIVFIQLRYWSRRNTVSTAEYNKSSDIFVCITFFI